MKSRVMTTSVLSIVLLCGAAAATVPSAGATRSQEGEAAGTEEVGSPVGIGVGLRNHKIAGPELEVAPIGDHTPIIVRLSATYPHGDDHRYDLVYYGLEPGDYDLLDFLRRKDGQPIEDAAPIPIRIGTVLPAGLVKPNELESRSVPTFLRYRFWLWYGGVLWVGGLVWLIRKGRRQEVAEDGTAERPITMAERLRPLVGGAMRGELDRNGRAELEMLLLAFWRKKRGLEEVGTAQAMAQLRSDSEAGPLIQQLEEWLHRPDPPQDVDLEVLLQPYQSLPADAVEDASPRREEVPTG